MNKPLRAAITALGVAVPERTVTNDDLSKLVDTNDEWITQRTGIKVRHAVSEGETTATLGAAAARMALADRGIKANELDLIICATISQEMMFPATACFIQSAIGATDVPAFDISAACSGFLYGLAVGSQFIQGGMYKRVMVIGAESLSRFTDYSDRGSCILFGDGAGAAILEATTEPGKGILYNVMHADGSGWDFIHVPAGGSRTPATHRSVDAGEHFIKLRGKEVYKFAVHQMAESIRQSMESCNLTVDQVKLVVPHQVNQRVIDSATEKVLVQG